MKIKGLFAIAWFSVYINAFAGISEGDKLETLKTLDGKTYEGITVSKISKEGVRFIHSSGVASVSVQQLPEDLLASFGLSVAEAEVAQEERKQIQKQNAEEGRKRLELLSRSRIIDGRIIQVLPDEKAVLVDLSKEGFLVSSAADDESRKKSLAAETPFRTVAGVTPMPGVAQAQMNHISRQNHLKLVPVTYKWSFYNEEKIVWIDLESTKGLIDDKMICGAFGSNTNWKKELWIVEEIGTTTYETNSGTRTVRRFKRRPEL